MGLCERFCKFSLFLFASNLRSRFGVVRTSLSGGVGAGDGNPKKINKFWLFSSLKDKDLTIDNKFNHVTL
mgnify:CR=1 FL=1